MKTTKTVKNIAVEFDHNGYFCHGVMLDDFSRAQMKRMEKRNGKETLDQIIPTDEPKISVVFSPRLMMQILAGWNVNDDFLQLQIYGDEKKMLVIRGQDEFAVLMGAMDDACENLLDIRKAAGLDKKEAKEGA